MKNGVKIAYLLMKAYLFASSASRRGYPYRKAVTCLDKVIDKVFKYMNNEERKVFLSRAEKIDVEKISYYEYMDCLTEAMNLLRRTRYRKLNRCVAIAGEVPEIVEDSMYLEAV